jgi:hypothetical protein
MPGAPRSSASPLSLLPPGWESWNPAEQALLLETLRQAKSARVPRDPLGWARERGIFWWSAQRAIAESVEANKRTVVRAGHAVGKSFTAAGLAGWWVDTKPDSMVITTAPTYDQVHGILWEEIRALHGRLGLPGNALATDEWKINGRQVAIGRKPPDNAKGSDFDPATFQGYHRSGGVLVILDEASGVPEWLWNAVETVTTTDNCRILAIGNPDNPGSHFAKVCAPGHPGWAQHKISVFDSPNFTGEDVPPQVSAALVTPSWAADRAAEWGEDDYKYISKVLAEFPSDHPRQVVSVADLLACQFPDVQPASALLPVELGVDVGGGGDETVVRERRGIRAGRQWTLRSDRPEEIAPLVLRAIIETGATAVKVDSIGVGFNVVGELRNMRTRGDHHAEVHGINVAEAATDPVKFVNRRADLWWTVGRMGSQRREWDLSQMEDSERTVAQLLQPRYFEDIKGRVQIEPKDDIRERTGGSPDRAEALLLAYVVPHDPMGSYFEAMTSGKLRG